MNVDELTIKEARELAAMFGQNRGSKSHSLSAGEKVFIRTVTHYYTGRIKVVTDSDIVLDDAAWIADTGRFSDALKSGKLNEVEPFPHSTTVSRGSIIDVSPWEHDLPREQK